MLEKWVLEKWNTGLLVKSLLTRKSIREYFLLRINPDKDGIFDIPLFHHSIIPCARQKIRPQKIPLFSISCTISETSS